jgi:hypothetical protein
MYLATPLRAIWLSRRRKIFICVRITEIDIENRECRNISLFLVCPTVEQNLLALA